MKKKKTVTEEDVKRALRKFINRGGTIRKLPPAKVADLTVVGSRHGRFEHPREMLSFTGSFQG